MLAQVFQTLGDVAQLGERGVRNAEARGSIPLISTISHHVKNKSLFYTQLLRCFFEIISLNIEDLC